MFTPNEYGLFSMPTLETPRLILRRMTMKDAKDIFEYSRDEEVACHVLWVRAKGYRRSEGLLPLHAAPLPQRTNLALGHHRRQTQGIWSAPSGLHGYSWITQVWKSAILWLVGFGTAAT